MTPKKFNEYLDKIRNGDTRAIKPIFNEYYKKMTLAACCKVRNVEDAKDIASAFLLYILQNAHKIEYIEDPNAWISQSVRNRAIDFIRKDSHTTYLSEHSDEVFSHHPDFDLRLTVADSLHVLTEIEREVFDLHFIYGLKYREISKQIGRPIGTIKSDVSIIKRKLQHLKHLK